MDTIPHYLEFVNKKSKNVKKDIDKSQNRDYIYINIAKLDFLEVINWILAR